MHTEKRLKLIRITEKIRRNPDFSKRLGIADTSCYRPYKAGILEKQ